MSRALRGVIDFLRRTMPVGDSSAASVPLTDRELLRRFADEADHDSFAQLVQRHAPMVQAVCERVVGQGPDADDAVQATFIVLARKVAAAGWHDCIAGWLHEVAYRVAARQKSAAACRRFHERQAPAMAAIDLPDLAMLHELRAVLDQELARLPEKYRVPLVLCYLEGKTNEEAAHLLGWTKGTVSGRLARARDLLRGRLTRKGVSLSAAGLAAALAEETASAAGASTTHAVLAATTVTSASAAVLTLAQGVIHTMFWNQVRMVAFKMLGVVALLAGIGTLSYTVLRAQHPKPASEEAGGAVALASEPAEEKVDKDAATAIRALIPQASSSSNADCQKLAAVGAPDPATLENQSLSLVLVTTDSEKVKEEAATKNFRLLMEPVRPDLLAKALSRSEAKGYCTLLQPEFITDVSCRVKGNEATGVVSFHADKLYEGRVEYTARRRKDGSWTIEEFRMDGYRLGVRLQANGNWQRFQIAAADPKEKPEPADDLTIKDPTSGITVRTTADRKSLRASKGNGEILWKTKVVPDGSASVVRKLHLHEGEVWVSCTEDKPNSGEPFHKVDLRTGKILHSQVNFPK
jgi:RNA polymerase sigma factor (sigma-70 family)